MEKRKGYYMIGDVQIANEDIFNYLLKVSARGLEIVLASFIVFAFVLDDIRLDTYLGVYATVIAIFYLGFGNGKNTSVLLKNLFNGFGITVGFGLAKIIAGCNVTDFCMHVSAIRLLLLLICFMEYIILALWMIGKTESREAAKDTVELYSERLADLERLEKYLSRLNVVGVNGKWGSGKTVLVDHYTRYKEKCEVIKVEPLTCNMDTIDVYLFEQLESVLRRNRIYPRYSRKVQRALSDNSWGKQIYNILSMDAIDQVTAFQGFCQDLEKLDKEVLVI